MRIVPIFKPLKIGTMTKLQPMTASTLSIAASVDINTKAMESERTTEIHPKIASLLSLDIKTIDFAWLGCKVAVTEPHLIPKFASKRTRMTLVIDIDETLVRAHCHNCNIAVRPGATRLLNDVMRNPEIEVFIWTAAVPIHAARCLYAIKRTYEIDYPGQKFEIDALICRGSWYTTFGKDVNRLSRPPLSSVLIDNYVEHVRQAKRCGVLIESYETDALHHAESCTYATSLSRVNVLCNLILTLCPCCEPVDVTKFLESDLPMSFGFEKRDSYVAITPPPPSTTKSEVDLGVDEFELL